MLRITYDHQVFAWQKYGGISRYYYELAKRVGRTPGFRASIVAPLYINNYLLKDRTGVKGVHVPRVRKTARLMAAANRLLAPYSIRKSRPDVLHETYYQHDSRSPKDCPSVITIYDMIHEKFAGDFSSQDHTSSAKRAAAARADFIICISENTRRDLIDLFGVPPEKTRTIHLGFALTAEDLPVPATLAIKPFILFVGQRRGYKNFDALLNAFASSKRLIREYDLIAFGGDAFSKSEESRIRAANIPLSSVRQVSGNDDQLALLYQQAAAFVYPSLYEGFGIPPLEAMSFNCPVLCSNTSSIPEVVGDAAYFFDPSDIDAIRTAMETVLESHEIRSSLVSRGQARVRLFSWDQCATETMCVYRQLKLRM